MFVAVACAAVVTTFSLVGYIVFEAEHDDKLYYLCYGAENSPVPLFRRAVHVLFIQFSCSFSRTR